MRLYFFICLLIFDLINLSLQIAKVDPECRPKFDKDLVGRLKECIHIGCEDENLVSKGRCWTPKECDLGDFRTAEIWYDGKEFPHCCPHNSCTRDPLNSKDGELLQPYDPGFIKE